MGEAEVNVRQRYGGLLGGIGEEAVIEVEPFNRGLT